jgi:hypothetical protein
MQPTVTARLSLFKRFTTSAAPGRDRPVPWFIADVCVRR